jgi:flagellar basal body rod protein FlgG
MATKSGGTKATTTLTGVQFSYGKTVLSDADLATIAQGIYDDAILARSFKNVNVPGSPFSRDGRLYVPNRGYLTVLPGDWVFIDPATGWPILISGNALPATLTATGNTHTSTLLDNLSTNVLALGWKPGMPITGTDMPAAVRIAAIAANGLSLTLSAAATGTHAGNTYTVSNYTHT